VLTIAYFMAERKFRLVGSSLIFCDLPCDIEFARKVEGKIKEVGNMTTTMRCVADRAALRGQHFSAPLEAHEKLTACRVCTIYTEVDNTKA